MKYYQIVFSPTGGTERVARAITQNWSQIDTIDLCTPIVHVDMHSCTHTVHTTDSLLSKHRSLRCRLMH